MPSVTMKNYESAVPEDWKDLMYSLGRGNNEVSVMEDIMRNIKEANYLFMCYLSQMVEFTKLMALRKF